MQEPSLRIRMGEAGRSFALGRFDANVMVDRLEEVYRTCVQNARLQIAN
jgi:hypothetical protein